ncbi:hypothetical protein OXX59_001226 [Metschnikowia pulcherrima]
MSSRRKSTINFSRPSRLERERDDSAALELERLEQETTLVLQDIDHNLSRANGVINDKMFPVLKKYAVATSKVWENVGFWKHFMEEAADVEVRTSNSINESKAGEANFADSGAPVATEKVSEQRTVSDDSSSSAGQIQASTPQQPRSRTPISSSRGDTSPRLSSRRPTSAYRRVSSSSTKNTPSRRQSQTEARRSSLILKHLNSSPTLPKSPVLMSEIGRHYPATSSSAARIPKAARSSSTDSESSDLGKLSPILLPSITLTPKAAKPQGESAQRFPKTPVYGSSALRRSEDRNSIGSPARRTPVSLRNSIPDAPDIPVPESVSRPMPRQDESDEIAVPQLLSLQKGDGKRKIPDSNPDATKKRKISEDDDNANIFLDHGNASGNASTLYHTMAHDSIHMGKGNVEPNSKTMSQIFEEVIHSGAQGQALVSPNKSDESRNESHGGALNEEILGQDENISSPVRGSQSEPDKEPVDNTGNWSQVINSYENATNSSDMDSFSKEKWKNFSKNLRR